MQIVNGNAHQDGAEFNHWFVGNLAEWTGNKRAGANDFSLRQSRAVQIKWGMHQAGQQRQQWAPCSNQRTLSLLVRGRFLLRFRSPNNREHILERHLAREGDYALWGTDLEHTWFIEEDALILTVRWHECE